jgi:hypothetical protein
MTAVAAIGLPKSVQKRPPISRKLPTTFEEYFDSGVKMVWHVFPNTEKIYIYTSPEHNQICRGEAICSAEEVITGFSIKAKDVFKLP